MEVEILENFNIWWRTGKVREELLAKYERHLFGKIQKYLKLRHIILIYGLRRVGKSTMLYQLISETLKSADADHILYFSFDDRRYALEEVLDTYQRMILHNTLDNVSGRVYVFLDEIQKIDDWESKIKVLYDLHPNVKFFLSGSASIALRNGAKESLAGRIFDFVLDPLSFAEFLEMQGNDISAIKENPALWNRTIVPLFNKYIKYGSFPELVKTRNEEIARKYINDDVVEKIIYKDLPESFGISDMELLKTIVDIVARNPGMLVDYASIAKDLKKDQRTISNYFEYLEFGMIIRFAFNFRGSPIASRRKLKKAYLQTPNIAFAYGTSIGALMPKMLENVVMASSGAKFFYRNAFEVDFILQEAGKLTGIKVKSSGADAKQLIKFREKFGDKVKKLLLLTNTEPERIKGVKTMQMWQYCLFGTDA
ncbi:MAG: ATP-binding protein [Candidatus Micrarchaeales archaeon]